MHKKCKEILAELGKKGDIVFYDDFEFPQPFKLETRLKDLLEIEVDEKYYLSQKMIDCFVARGDISKGYEFKPTDGNTIANCLVSKEGNYSTNNYIKVKSNTSQGYEIATPNDSINFTNPNSKTRRGRVVKEVTQTLDCACNQGVICYGGSQANAAKMKNISPCLTSAMGLGGGHTPRIGTETTQIRKLTPKECFRLQGVKDDDIDLVVSNTQAYKIAGNAISVNVIQSILRSIYKNKTQNLFSF